MTTQINTSTADLSQTTTKDFNLTNTHISFIGGGNMAVAMLAGLRANGFASQQLLVIEPDEDKRASLTKQFNVQTHCDLNAVFSVEQNDTHVLVMAVKPQQLKAVCNAISMRLSDKVSLGTHIHLFQSQLLIVSIAAGISANMLENWLGGHRNIVRVMPNTPAQIQAGVSALYALPSVSVQHQSTANAILQAVGATLWLTDEAKMDAVTAISGSGPAYVFYLIEALQAAGEKLGLTQDEAKLLALQTFAGASQLAAQSQLAVTTLRAQVTSKGGTTEQGIAVLEATNISQIIYEAARAAADKSIALQSELLT